MSRWLSFAEYKHWQYLLLEVQWCRDIEFVLMLLFSVICDMFDVQMLAYHMCNFEDVLCVLLSEVLCVLLSQAGSLRFAGLALLALRLYSFRAPKENSILPGYAEDCFGPQTSRPTAICISNI